MVCTLAIACSVVEAKATSDATASPPEAHESKPMAAPAEASAFLQHLESIRRGRLSLETRRREFNEGIGPEWPIFPHSARRAMIDVLASVGDSSGAHAELSRRAKRAEEALATIDSLSAEYSELQSRAIDVPVEDQRMRQIGLLYSIALALERKAFQRWGEVLVYGEGESVGADPRRGSGALLMVLSLMARASDIYAYADSNVSSTWENADIGSQISSADASSARPKSSDF